MILLDTDHVTVLRYVDHPRCAALIARLHSARDPRVALTAITLEEQMRGWLAEISRAKDIHRQVSAYDGLLKLHDFLYDWEVVPFDHAAADQFGRLRKQHVRIGSQDLKIASVALAHGALLLSANLRDFRRVPGLQVEDWLEARDQATP